MSHTQNNNTIETKEKATVSIRNMNLKVWYMGQYLAKLQGVTTANYIETLLMEDWNDKTSGNTEEPKHINSTSTD